MTAPGQPPTDLVRLVVSGAADEGRGHVARALALAEGLRSRSLTATITCLRGRLTEREAARAAALDVAIVTDRAAGNPAVLVVDLPDANETVQRPSGSRLVVFDDRDRFRGEADLVIQPSQRAWSGTGRAGRVLAGYDMIPLAGRIPELAATSARIETSSALAGRRPRILVCFGGSDPSRVSERLVGALAGGGWDTTIVLGASYAGSTDGWPIEPVRDPPDLAERLAGCDVAVLGAGTMKFEAACLGRPAVLLAAADDQLPVGVAYGETGAALWLGDGRTIEPDTVAAAIQSLLDDAGRRRTMAAAGRALVDGRGALRIAAAVRQLMPA